MNCPAEMQFHVGSLDSMEIADSEISGLLTTVYVEGGFTAPDRASILFSPPAVRRRGLLLGARPQAGTGLAGMVIVVPPGSPARRLAAPDEAEMHLLAVAPAYRGLGLGHILVHTAMGAADELGFRKMVLWTQGSMSAAQQLYASAGFVRATHRDPIYDGIRFLAYEKQW